MTIVVQQDHSAWIAYPENHPELAQRALTPTAALAELVVELAPRLGLDISWRDADGREMSNTRRKDGPRSGA
jgi:hypothetical protein